MSNIIYGIKGGDTMRITLYDMEWVLKFHEDGYHFKLGETGWRHIGEMANLHQGMADDYANGRLKEGNVYS